MTNKENKPKLNSLDLIKKMKKKNITFNHISEENAAFYLSKVNNYMRTASYRKNYQKFTNGINKGKYIDLDFSYLKELSTIDMHFRFVLSKMCLDIEHALKVKIANDIENNTKTDGYDIVHSFLNNNTHIIHKIEATSTSPYIADLIHKYFTITTELDCKTNRRQNIITSYDDCPAWAFLEMLTFGDLLKFYKFYYPNQTYNTISLPILNLVKSLRNGVAHNNCILMNLTPGSSRPPLEINI